ncbi:hypothetical protein Taro_035012 [Colocasia esculenta]|uniref:Transcription repressor n=1 Tax=Colocasia esculenta TaxID=4460 RepID=A0A843W990_COLES|nr:hypothetical protein [Colocasia esculenta]
MGTRTTTTSSSSSFCCRKHHNHKQHKYHTARPSCRYCRCRPPSRPKRCHATTLCCGGSTRLSVSSTTGDEDDAEEAEFHPAADHHALVQERLEQMIANKGRRKGITAGGGGGEGRRWVVVVAVEKESYEPRAEFRESMMEVIKSNGMEEARELRNLLRCYMSMNSREHRVVILEAFHDVCASLFSHAHGHYLPVNG